MHALFQDVKCSMRILRRHRGLSAAAIGTLALAIGANTAIFSVVHGVLLRPLPFAAVDRIVTLWETDPARGVERQLTSPANFLDVQEQTTVFDALAMAEPFSHTLVGEGEPETFRSWNVSSGFFETLGTAPLLGRTFAAEEHAAGSAQVVVLSHGVWDRRFGRDPGIVGRTLTLNGRPTRVVGVMPPDFDVPQGRDLWGARQPTARDPLVRGATYIHVVARLKPAASLAATQQELGVIAERLSADHPQTNAGIGIAAVPLREHLFGSIRPALLTLVGTVGLVLLIASANVANLLVAHAQGRRREFAVRRALGVQPLVLLRLILTESLLLALAGGAIGVLAAYWLVDVVGVMSAPHLPRGADVGVSVPVLLFALGVSTLTAIVVGLAAFTSAARADAVDVTRDHGDGRLSGSARGVAGPALIVAQVSLAFLVVVSAGLLYRSYANLSAVDPGFAADGLALEVNMARRPPADRAAFMRATIERLTALPGVRAAGATSALPFHPGQVVNPTQVTIEGRAASATGADATDLITVTPRYFEAVDIPLLEGRMFEEADGTAARVAILNQAMARRFWPGESPIGRRVSFSAGGPRVDVEIVGVVGDARSISLDQEPKPEMYLPLASLVGYSGTMTYFVRTAGPPRALLPQVKDAIRAENPTQTFPSVTTVGELVEGSLAQRKLVLILFGGFALLALAVAAVGICGAVSYASARRTAEIGLRIALGSSNGQVLKLMMSQAMRPVLGGIALGLVASIAGTRLLAAELYQVSPVDPLTLAAIAGLFIVVSLLAAYIPARAAVRLDPLVALREA